MSADKKLGVNGSIERRSQVLFVDARKAASGRLSRTQVEFTDNDLEQIALVYHRWRGTDFSDGIEYVNVPGFCYSASADEVREHGFLLTPGRYVGADHIDEDQGSFAQTMQNLTEQLSEQLVKGVALDQEIRTRLGALGYVV